jgi:DNA-binding LacI/PurR family transcriptional regulator
MVGVSLAVISQQSSPTLAHVAAMAGVSPATVSRVLSGSAPVSRETRASVERAVRALGYVRPRGTPQTGRSISVVICEDSMRVFADPFFARLLAGINQELRDRANPVVLMIGKAEEWDAVGEYLRTGRVAGCLLIGSRQEAPLDLLPVGLPVVLAGRPLGDIRLPYVDADNQGGARRAVEYLLSSGRRVIGTVAGPAGLRAGGDRLAGYRNALSEAGIETTAGLIAHGDFSGPSGEHAMSRLLDRRPDLDAVLVASDLMAVGALRVLKRTGRSVPGDVAVIGFDDAPLARKIRPQLTTVRQPVEEMGARMARELLTRIGGGPGSDRSVLKTKLIIRETA